MAEHGIHRVSLYVSLEGEQRPEIEIAESEYAEFYERLRRSDEGATTSQPSVGDFLSVYSPLLAEGREIVSIHLSAGISGTCESARQARQRLLDEGEGGERIHVFDSRSACGGQGLVVLAAANAAAAGAERRGDPRGRRAMPAAPRDVVRDRHARIPAKGRADRRGPGVARVGASDQADPDPGEEITPVERVRTRRRALERLVEYARQRHARRRRRLGGPAHPGSARRRAAWWSRAARSSGPIPRSSPRSAP